MADSLMCLKKNKYQSRTLYKEICLSTVIMKLCLLSNKQKLKVYHKLSLKKTLIRILLTRMTGSDFGKSENSFNNSHNNVSH